WDDYLREWGGEAVTEADGFEPWTLKARTCLNPDSSAAGLYQIDFTADSLDWQAGDLAEIRTPDGHRRDYSIASLPEEGTLRLYVREVIKDDGMRGVGSGLLTIGVAEGDRIDMR